MHIKIETLVQGDYRQVMKGFNLETFQQLAPPGSGLEVLRFDGSLPGDEVHLRLKLAGLIPQDWVSVITEAGENEQEVWFVDEGRKLPFFLKTWHHRHVVQNEGSNARIIDDIQFTSFNTAMDYLLYPVLYAQFAYRKPVYRKIFGEATTDSR